VPDNWAAGSYYNVPLKDLMQIIESAINSGYTVAWDGDVSDEKGFSTNGGIATIEDESKEVTSSIRQQAFNDFSTTDDHLMHLTGIGEDSSGNKFYLTKNSWGTAKGKDGYWWMSENSK
jgi:bleomycin hydrolase